MRCSVIYLVVASAAIAQDLAGPPLEIVMKSGPYVDQPDARVELQLTNNSSRRIAAYVLRHEYVDERTGSPAWILATAVATGGVVPAFRGASYVPGQVWTDTIRRHPAPKAGARYRIHSTVDYVMFIDGSGWGPDKKKLSLKLQGMRDGARLQQEMLERK
jgi:hypothetical protein